MEKKECSQERQSSSFPQTTPLLTQKGNQSPLTIRIRKKESGDEEFLGFFWKGKQIPTPCLYFTRNGKIVGATLIELPKHLEKDREYLSWLKYSQQTFVRTLEAIEAGASDEEKVMAYTLDAVSLTKDCEAGLKRIDTKDAYKIVNALKAKSPFQKLDSLDRLLLDNWHRKRWMNITLERLGEVCGKALKRKPFPKTTMQKRLDALLLQTQVKPGARPKPASLKAVSQYTKQRNGLQSIKNRIGKRVL